MVTYIEQLRDKGTAGDVAQQTNSLHIRAGELMKLDVIHQSINNLDSHDVTFTPAARPTTQSHGSRVVGKIHGTMITKVCYISVHASQLIRFASQTKAVY